MKTLSKFASIAGGLTALAMVAFTAAPALADSPGQLQGGTGVYVVKNVTKGSAYAPSTNAGTCDTLRYSIRLHNTSFGGFTNVHVKVNLPSNSSTQNVSTVTATTNLGGTTGTTGTATVNMGSAQTIAFVAGSATLYNASGSVIKTLPDSLVTSGVDIGGLNGSTTEFVNYDAKVNCPPVVQPPVFSCDMLKVTQDSRTKFTFEASATANNGATISKYVFNFGDNTQVESTSNKVSHEYAKEGTYNVTVTVFVKVNGKDQAVTGDKCKASVTVKPTETTTPPATTPAATELPNTGAGDLFGIFAGASSAGAAAHYAVRRRSNR